MYMYGKRSRTNGKAPVAVASFLRWRRRHMVSVCMVTGRLDGGKSESSFREVQSESRLCDLEDE